MASILCSIYETINQCDADEWDELIRTSGEDIFLSHGFIAAVEDAFKDEARFAHVVVHNENGQ